jgi:molecular chaperone DnaK
MTGPILGIDLGTTNSLVGVVDSGFPILLADANGSRITPSAVYFPEGEKEEPLVGAEALRLRMVKGERVITSVKRLMGTRDPVIAWRGEKLGAEAVSALILAKLKGIAEAAMAEETAGEPIRRAVITVPAYFNDGQRNATKRAGELAGLTVERIVNEPTAAALAYGLDKLGERSKVAVYDFGGGTFDISILELSEGVFQVLSTNGDTRLGGDDVDRALAEALWRVAGGGERPMPASFEEAARQSKCALSTEASFIVRLPFYDGEKSFEREITREWFESVVGRVIERTRGHCLRALSDAALEVSALDAVVLVGGSTRIPLVRALVREVFGREPDISQNPDEAVALGAVIQAGILSGAMRNMVLLDVTPLSLGIETFGGLMNVIIPRNTTIPVKRGELFTNAVADQSSMRIRALQGERELAKDNWELGSFEIPFERGGRGSARVGVQFAIDANGILQVLARDTATGRDEVLEIQSAAVDVGDEKVEAMINESVEHAFEDLNARLWTEAKMKSDELLPAVDQAMEMLGDSLDEVEKARVDAATEEVRVALESGSVNRLKTANKALDEATEVMAAMLVERAMGGI